jgi:predicted enzyme related to lactoylglutathione lyase
MSNTQHPNAVEWFEIPTADFSKSIPFYNQVLGIQLEATEFGPTHIAVFPYTRPGVGGCLLQETGLLPSGHGTIVYMPTPKLDAAIARVEPAGGEVVVPKTPVGPNMGYFARLREPEGNIIGLFGLE